MSIAQVGFAQGVDSTKTERLDSVVVLSSRAGKSTPVTYTMISGSELSRTSPLNSLPMSLSLQPSVVAVNEGGTGIGYSKLTVRGSKGSQINVTLNGITLNDAESQEVFWVNIPSLASYLSSVQLQRGLGTSASGAGAFGASINMSTMSVRNEAGGWVDISRGAWNTMKTTVGLSSGRSKHGFYADAVYSKNTTDGYIRNAYGDVQSALAVLGWISDRNSLRITYLWGNQHTGITWEGIPASMVESNRRYNPAGEYTDAFGNVHYYDNESDNYAQHHLQLSYVHQFMDALTWSTTLNYTKGDGYYDQYKTGKKLTAYGFTSPVEIDGTSYTKGDFITHKSMDNAYYVVNSDLRYSKGALKAVFGVNASVYDGDHFGNVVWSNLLGDVDDHRWYENNGLKKDFSIFARGEYDLNRAWTAYVDLQYRSIRLDMKGVDDDFSDLTYGTSWSFFNPRAGITFTPARGHKAYFSVAQGHREPGRSDIKEVIESNNAGASRNELKPERMLDFELGYEFSSGLFSATVNLYAMEYWDMLLETGKLSDSGYAIKENVGRAWRRGVEVGCSVGPYEGVRAFCNLTLSDNRIKDFTAFVSKYDNMNDWNYLGQLEEKYSNTRMLMSPSVVGAVGIEYRPFTEIRGLENLCLEYGYKYVGKQYWDNTGDNSRSLPAYYVTNAAISHVFDFKGGNSVKIGLYVNNLLGAKYCADAWVYRAYFEAEGKYYQEEGLFPQAPTSCMLRMVYSF